MTTSLDARINAMISLLIRPNQTFREITENHNNFFVTAIAILVIASFFFFSYTLEDPDTPLPKNELGYVLDAGKQVESFGVSVLLNLFSIVIVFFLGKRFGGNDNFRKVFSVMTFAMVPVLIGGVILHVFLIYPPLLASMTGLDANSTEFAGLFWLLYFMFVPFVFWSLILSIKAIKVVDNFGTAKAFGIFISSAIVVYFVSWGTALVL